MRRPPRSTLFPYTSSSDLARVVSLAVTGRTLYERIVVRHAGLLRRLRDTVDVAAERDHRLDRKSTRLNSSHSQISYAVFCLKKKTMIIVTHDHRSHHSLDS